ncbi:MAG: hypothetical protein H0W83_13440, partial [Planctomycetes bacterium]|nr:hypothetical protein [Planctomycetota bacterium]
MVAVLMLLSSGRCAAEDAAPTPDSVSTPGTAHAHQDGISIGIANRILFPRAYAPLPVQLAMACDEGTRTGRLRLRLQDGSETLYTWIGPEWTLTRAPRTVEQLLPPVPMEEMHGELQASMEWVEDGRTVRFAPLAVTVPGRSERPLCLGLCMSTGIDTRAVVRLASLERFRP